MMRRILVDHARAHRAAKRPRTAFKVMLDERIGATEPRACDLLALDEALATFTSEDPARAELVKLHYFAGLSVEEAGEMLGLSRTSAYRLWTFVRAWLRCQLSGDGAEPDR